MVEGWVKTSEFVVRPRQQSDKLNFLSETKLSLTLMATRQLKKENDDLKKQVEQLISEISTLKERFKMADHSTEVARRNPAEASQIDPKYVQFLSDGYDDLLDFCQSTAEQLTLIENKLKSTERYESMNWRPPLMRQRFIVVSMT